MTRTIILNEDHSVSSSITPSQADKITIENARRWQAEKARREGAKKFYNIAERAHVNFAWDAIKVR